MSPKLYDSEDAEFKQQHNFNTKLFEELLPRYDARYNQFLKENLMVKDKGLGQMVVLI